MEKWLTVQELLGLKTLPSSDRGITKKSQRENWEKRQREGVKGKTFEYKFSSLPEETQAELLLRQPQSVVENSPVLETAPKKPLNYLPEVIWAPFDKATDAQRAKAQARLKPVTAFADLLLHGQTFDTALNLVATEFDVAEGSLKRWYYHVKPFERSDWLPRLLPSYGRRKGKEAEFTDAAWESFKADYFRNERPQFGACFERLKRAAKEQGWSIPSASSVKRKIEREIPIVQRAILRDGPSAAMKYYPAMKRSVASLEALEWINGDGYQHNVFVKWHNGDIVRPKTWFWQDIRTRKILAYRTDLSENSDTIRLSLMDVVWKYGIPKKLTIDNTRAAANKWMTGGVPNRYRFAVKDDDVLGIIPQLGIELYWTSIQEKKGHGQAKPVERAFGIGGLGEYIDKHPKLAGFFAGESVGKQPDNYNGGKDGVAYDTFILALEDGIRTFNEKEERETEICQGVYSFSQVFERDYALAHIRKASPEQMRILMLMSEATSIKQNGTFELDIGGSLHGGKNQYTAWDLIGSRHKKVVVKFDPADLHNTVWVYSLDGVFLAEAECTSAKAFGDRKAAREHNKARRQWMKAQKAAAKAQLTMNAQEAARYQPEFEEEDRPEPKIIELLQAQGNVVKKVQALADDDEDENSFETALYAGLRQLKQQN